MCHFFYLSCSISPNTSWHHMKLGMCVYHEYVNNLDKDPIRAHTTWPCHTRRTTPSLRDCTHLFAHRICLHDKHLTPTSFRVPDHPQDMVPRQASSRHHTMGPRRASYRRPPKIFGVVGNTTLTNHNHTALLDARARLILSSTLFTPRVTLVKLLPKSLCHQLYLLRY